MEVIAGHFSYLEFITSSEIRYPQARELTCQARTAVTKVRENQLESGTANVTEGPDELLNLSDGFSFSEVHILPSALPLL
jgi:hypothetical protein